MIKTTIRIVQNVLYMGSLMAMVMAANLLVGTMDDINTEETKR